MVATIMAFVSSRSSYRKAVLVTLAVGLFVSSVAPLHAASPARAVSSSRATVQARVRRLEAAEKRAAEIDKRLADASARLDRILAEQSSTRARLGSRVSAMYRTGDASLLAVLFEATSFEDFAARWSLLTRMNMRDAAALRRLQVLRARALKTTRDMLRLQEGAAKAADDAAHELSDARKALADDQAALAALNARAAAKPRPAARHDVGHPVPRLHGTGDWKVGVASHYGRNFSGRGASGVRIGPYSMIVAHKTLPFGTLIEFEFRGRRAVASVQDRGPRSASRDFDLGPGVVRMLDFEGVQQVRYRIIQR